jgi:hypothetical protein
MYWIRQEIKSQHFYYCRDIASYVHNRLWVIVDHEQKRLVFLVDYGPPNRKWSKSSEVWQRFVSQVSARLSSEKCARFFWLLLGKLHTGTLMRHFRGLAEE